jgi:membrane protease YdiL (CAAX protease family)
MKNKYIKFYVSALLFSWLAWLPYGAFRAGVIELVIPWEIVLIGQFGPSLVAVLLVLREHGISGLREFLQKSFQLKIKWKYILVSIFTAPAIALLLILIYKAIGAESPSFQELANWPGLYALDYGTGGPYTISGELVPNIGFVEAVTGLINQGHLMAITIFVMLALITGPLSEELGWRGYLLPGFLAKWSPLKSSVIIGLLWGWWHTGPDFWQFIFEGKIGAFLYPIAITLGTLPLSILFTWLFLKTRASLIPVMLFHASFNSTLYILNLVWTTQHPLIIGGQLIFGLWIISFVIGCKLKVLGYSRPK